MDKQASVLDSKFFTLFIRNFRENLALKKLTESKGK